MNKYSVNEEAKKVDLFDERFYQIEGKDVFNVTGWLEGFPKGNGFNQWLKTTKDPDAVRDEAAQLGSEVHRLIELTLLGDTVKWQEGLTKLEVWERYLGWCNFWYDLKTDPNTTLDLKKIKEIKIEEKFTEFITYDLELGYAGTVDKMIKLIYTDDSYQFVILDWKSGNNIHDTAYIQISAYAHSVMKQFKIKDLLGFVVQVNPTLNKKGYRVYPVDVESEFQYFLAAQLNYRRAFGEPKPKYRTYPTEINLESINKIIEVK